LRQSTPRAWRPMTKVMEAQTLEAGPALAYVDGSFFC
jgi:hypothetical protein